MVSFSLFLGGGGGGGRISVDWGQNQEQVKTKTKKVSLTCLVVLRVVAQVWTFVAAHAPPPHHPCKKAMTDYDYLDRYI